MPTVISSPVKLEPCDAEALGRLLRIDDLIGSNPTPDEVMAAMTEADSRAIELTRCIREQETAR